MHRLCSFVLLALAAALAGACTTQLPPVEGSFEDAIAVYLDSEPEKALALAADEAGRSAWGAAVGAWTVGGARDRALEACRASAERQGVEAPCHLFAVGEAPAESILRACGEGRAGERRCALQKTHGPRLAE